MRFSATIATAAAVFFAAASFVSGSAMPELETRATDLTPKFATGTAKLVDAAADQDVNSVTTGTYTTAKSNAAVSNAAAASYSVLYGCDGYNFTGQCWYLIISSFGPCYNIPSAANNKISSLRELYTNVGCYLYTNSGCSGSVGYIQYSNGPVGNIGSPYNNNLSSVRCYILS